MGIQGLLPLLKSVTKKVHIENFTGQAVAIDAYSWLHKGVYTCVADLYHQRPTTAFVEYCMGKIRLLQRYNVKPIMVFDGGPLPMKAYREEQRAKNRSESKKKADEFMKLNGSASAQMSTAAYSHMSKSTDVTPEMAFMLIEALKRESVDFIVAPYEADAQMAYLSRIGMVQAVISEDSDLLLFGIKRILFKMDKFGNAEEICLDQLGSCEEIDLRDFTLKKFRQMCILSGCDYLAPLGGIGLKTLHKFFLKYKRIDQVLNALRREANKYITKEYENEFIKAELTFQHQRVFCPLEQKIVSLHPLPDDIYSSIELETDMEFEEGFSFLGPVHDVEIARGIALGKINPITHAPFMKEESVQVQGKNVKKMPELKGHQVAPLNALLRHEGLMADGRLTVKRPFSSHVVSIQQGLRSKFSEAGIKNEIPRYATVRKPVTAMTKTADGKRQFSILNFCIPKPKDQENREDNNS